MEAEPQAIVVSDRTHSYFWVHSGFMGMNKITDNMSRRLTAIGHNGLCDMTITGLEVILCHPIIHYVSDNAPDRSEYPPQLGLNGNQKDELR